MGGPRVLIVEDHTLNLELAVDVLEAAGYAVLQARDAQSWDSAMLQVVSRRQPTLEEWPSLEFAWRVFFRSQPR